MSYPVNHANHGSDRLISIVFKRSLKPTEIDKESTTQTATHLMQGVYKGYGGTFADFKFNTPDYDKLMHIEKNVYSFAAAKNWQMLKELTMAIKDGDKTLSFNEFKQKASKILTDYDVNYLRTEYNAAIAGAQMASKWVDFEKHPDELLEYRTQEDIRVRVEHQALDKITRPVNDPFWNTYYPPNGWNCRCTVIRLPYSKTNKPSTQKEVNHATADCTPQKGFATNLAKSGFVFPKNSAIFIGVPDAVKEQAFSLLPYQHRFNTIYESKSGGSVKVHADYKEGKDHELINSIAHEKADVGDNVEILPIVHIKEPEKRDALLPEAKFGKNPDLRINGKYVEVEHPESVNINAISRRIKNGAKQADHLIINLNENVDNALLQNISKGKFKGNKDLMTIEFRYNGKYHKFIK